MFVAVFAHVVAICISVVQPGIGKYLLTLIVLSKVFAVWQTIVRQVHFLAHAQTVGGPVICFNDVPTRRGR